MALMAFVLSATFLGACRSGSPNFQSTEEIALVRYVSVKGVTYGVSRSVRGENLYNVSTRGGRPGDTAGMQTAVLRAYNCQNTTLAWTAPDLKAAEVRGSFCR